MDNALSSQQANEEISHILLKTRAQIMQLQQEQEKMFDEYCDRLTELRIATIIKELNATEF